MAIAIATTRQALATHYGTLGTFIGVCTGDPGTAGPPVNEATGGTPPYARLATTWTDDAAGGGIINGSDVQLDVPPGDYDHILLAVAATGDQLDNAITDLVSMSLQGKITVTPLYTQT
jgi:hypothetical protein